MKNCPACKRPFEKMNNKIKPGDKVAMSLDWVKWQLDNFNQNYLAPGTFEVEEKDYIDAHFFLDSYLKKIEPVGTVIEYGAEDRHERGRLNLRVRFEHLDQTIFEILNEDDVRKVKNVPVKKRKTNKRKA